MVCRTLAGAALVSALWAQQALAFVAGPAPGIVCPPAAGPEMVSAGCALVARARRGNLEPRHVMTCHTSRSVLSARRGPQQSRSDCKVVPGSLSCAPRSGPEVLLRVAGVSSQRFCVPLCS